MTIEASAASSEPHIDSLPQPVERPAAPRLLLIATVPWIFPARLAKALRTAGLHVEAVCRARHPLRLSRQSPRLHRLGLVGEVRSVAAAIDRSEPELLIPCDDPAVSILHALHGRDGGGKLSDLIERSLGDPQGFGVVASKSSLIALARSLGLLVPASVPVSSRAVLLQTLERTGYPRVLKRDRTWGGAGVRVLHNDADARAAWRDVVGWVSVLRAGRAAQRDKRLRALLDPFANWSAAVELQEFVNGTAANRAILCSRGKVLAGISVAACETLYPTGPASVVRVIEHPDMTHAAAVLAERLGLSGFFGFDFVISSSSGRAHLIEANPRVTPISHLAFANGTHLPAALYAQMTGMEPRPASVQVPGDHIALYPTEWLRDPSSPYLCRVYHDVPWDEPALVENGRPRSLKPSSVDQTWSRVARWVGIRG
jgi:predicted ATP-grasp superfamily ATP-dependent carboligase